MLCRNREDCATASERKCVADIFYVENPRKFQTESVNTIELPWDIDPYPRQSYLIYFLSLF